MKMKMLYLFSAVVLLVVGILVWKMLSRNGYESAEYKVLETDGNIEIREYPQLMLAVTVSKIDAQGRDGSFMRLFRYISGANENNQKIAMTTPVFMESENSESNASMGFVIPKSVAEAGVPEPNGQGVTIAERDGGRFAVIRFSGRLDTQLAKKQESKLRGWLESRGLQGESTAEMAGYDPPFTPRPMRRNEVLIRLIQANEGEADR